MIGQAQQGASRVSRTLAAAKSPASIERGRTRPLNRILEAAKTRREPVWALSERNERELFLERGRLYKISRVIRALKPGACRFGGLVPPREGKGDGRDALNGVWE